MSYSLNEVEALAKKATRGAGYSWGMAEEASKAVRVLSAHGLDGCGALADTLVQFDAAGPGQCHPVGEFGVWRAPQGALCPITVGTILSDRAEQMTAKPLRAEQVAQPILLLPFALQVARAIKHTVTLTTRQSVVATDGKSVSVQGSWIAHAEYVQIETGGTVETPIATSSRAKVEDHVWAKLNAFAHRTYAPATEESRRKGAG